MFILLAISLKARKVRSCYSPTLWKKNFIGPLPTPSFFLGINWTKQQLIPIIKLYFYSKIPSRFTIWTNLLRFLLIIVSYSDTEIFVCKYNNSSGRDRGHRAVYYTGPQSFLITFFIRWLNNIGDFLWNFNWLVH